MGSHSTRVQNKRLKCLRIQKYLCFFCDKDTAVTKCSLDHLYPLRLVKEFLGDLYESTKGLNDNSVAACKKCNGKKDDRLPTMTEVHKYQKIYGRTPVYFYTIGVSDLNATA